MNGQSPKLAVIDNYDSFTYNLVQYLGELGVEPVVYRNDSVTVGELASYDGIVISPGPGTPEEAGISTQVIKDLSGKVTILGVCLGISALARRLEAGWCATSPRTGRPPGSAMTTPACWQG